MAIGSSGEDYLETILLLEHANHNVRSIDVAHELKFSKPSVSVAMKKLREDNMIKMDSDGSIILTEQGRALAESIYERHELISSLLIAIGVDKETALKDACEIEHVISQKTFEALKNLAIKNIKTGRD